MNIQDTLSWYLVNIFVIELNALLYNNNLNAFASFECFTIYNIFWMLFRPWMLLLYIIIFVIFCNDFCYIDCNAKHLYTSCHRWIIVDDSHLCDEVGWPNVGLFATPLPYGGDGDWLGNWEDWHFCGLCPLLWNRLLCRSLLP